MAKEKVLEFIVDSREQTAFPFKKPSVQALNVGDYSVVGYDKVISVERKSVPDACSSVVSGRERFEREWERAASYKYFAVVIEGTIQDMRDYLKKQFYMMYKGANRKKFYFRLAGQLKSVPHTYISWSAKHKVPVFFCSSRDEAMEVTEEFLKNSVRHLEGEKDEK